MKLGKVLITERELKYTALQLGSEIRAAYGNTDLVALVTLKGAMFFAADVLREVGPEHVEIQFIKLSSYKGETKSRGIIEVDPSLHPTLHDRHVLIIEDIVDTGHTLDTLRVLCHTLHAKSVKVCSLLVKQKAKGKFDIDFLGKVIPNVFVVGYGLDYQEHYRNLRQILVLEE